MCGCLRGLTLVRGLLLFIFSMLRGFPIWVLLVVLVFRFVDFVLGVLFDLMLVLLCLLFYGLAGLVVVLLFRFWVYFGFATWV